MNHIIQRHVGLGAAAFGLLSTTFSLLCKGLWINAGSTFFGAFTCAVFAVDSYRDYRRAQPDPEREYITYVIRRQFRRPGRG